MSKTDNSVTKHDSHSYVLRVFAVGEDGLEVVGGQHLTLVRGSKVEGENKIEKQDGVLTEQLLTVAAEYLRSVNVGEMRTRESSVAITKIEEALLWLGKRTADRQGRGVLNTYQK